MFMPQNTQEVCEIVRESAASGKALVPCSSQEPHLHEGSVNSSAETICFEKMNRIQKISRHDRYARVEAGVTFGELLPALAEQGLRANHPFLPRAGKSVVASMLEREAVLIPKYQYDYTDPLLTAEVVYGTGELFRTGSAAGPAPLEETKADMVNPWGPGSVDFARFLCGAQGTMGLVTWATLKAEVAPTDSVLTFIESDDLASLVRLASKLLFHRIPDDCLILNNVNFAAAFAADANEEESLRKQAAPWTLLCRISGYARSPEERIKIYTGYLQDECSKESLSPLYSPRNLDGFGERADLRLQDCDRNEVYWKLRHGALRDILFLAPPSKTAQLTGALSELLAAHPSDDLGLTLQAQVQGRAFRVEADLFCPKEALEKTRQLADSAEASLFNRGALFDRPYTPALSRLVFDADPVVTAEQKKLKAVFDPQGILNPGKLCF